MDPEHQVSLQSTEKILVRRLLYALLAAGLIFLVILIILDVGLGMSFLLGDLPERLMRQMENETGRTDVDVNVGQLMFYSQDKFLNIVADLNMVVCPNEILKANGLTSGHCVQNVTLLVDMLIIYDY